MWYKGRQSTIYFCTARMKLKYLILTALSLTTGVFALPAPYQSRLQQESGGLIVRNRILVRVNDKTISVMDVMKKMDAYLLEYSPETLSNKEARAQFLIRNWKEFFAQLIDNELILAEAIEKEMKVTDGDVRKELQERFGPNLIENLDKMGLTYQEAFDLVKNDILVQSMSWHHVNAKALQRVGPTELKKAYQSYLQSNPPQETFVYDVMNFAGKTKEQSEKYAQLAKNLIDTQKLSAQEAAESVKLTLATGDEVAINFSSQTIDGKSISKNLKDTLLSLAPLNASDPIALAKRNDTTVKVYLLKEHKIDLQLPFNALENRLKNELLQKVANDESAKFVQWLKSKYSLKPHHLEEMCPSDFQPFTWVP